MVVIGFGLLTLPFLVNHLDRGSFYYQEVPIELPEVLPIETPPTVDLPVATPVESGVPPAEEGLTPVEPALPETESGAPDAPSDEVIATPDETPLPEPGAAE